MLIVNGKQFTVDDISTGSEIYVVVQTVEEALEAFTTLRSMGAYLLHGSLYVDRTVSKITLSEVKGDSIRVIVKLRKVLAEDTADAAAVNLVASARAEAEAAKAELEDLKTMIAPLMTSKANISALKTLQATYPELAVSTKETEEIK